jgi:hypothetical protein
MSASPASKSPAGFVAFMATSEGRIEVRHGWGTEYPPQRAR